MNKLKEKIGIAIGEASMCWSEPPTGIFDSTRATRIVDELCAALQATPVEKVEGLAEALREFDDLPEQDTTSLIILKAARLQLARQEGK